MDPTMMFVGVEHWYQVVLICITSIIGIYGVASGLAGYTFTDMPWYIRILAIAGGLLLLAPSTWTDIAGLAVVAGVIAIQYLLSRKQKTPAAAKDDNRKRAGRPALFCWLNLAAPGEIRLRRAMEKGRSQSALIRTFSYREKLYARYGFSSSSMAAARAARRWSASASESPRTPV